MRQYASKALSEAKVNLSWINPDPEYVKAVQGFLEDILIASGRRKETRFVESLGSLMPQLKIFGALNSLSQLVLKIASPGVPDFYQGNELWELTLVDPDNRQPVDYDIRNRHLEALDQMLQRQGAARVCDELMRTIEDGRIKLWTMWRALALRKTYSQVFERGEYLALPIRQAGPERKCRGICPAQPREWKDNHCRCATIRLFHGERQGGDAAAGCVGQGDHRTTESLDRPLYQRLHG